MRVPRLLRRKGVLDEDAARAAGHEERVVHGFDLDVGGAVRAHGGRAPTCCVPP